MLKKLICLIGISFLCSFCFVSAQNNGGNDSKSITLVVSGTGKTEAEATNTALRSALEQTYGTFVSSNTQIVNDEMTKDEIVSISAGNIEHYDVVDNTKLEDGQISVTVKATVSIGKLLQFAQSKGATTELAGATFAMNIKMRKLNKENEIQALKDMFEKMILIAKNNNIFDYSLKTGAPKQVDGRVDVYRIPLTITITPNANYSNMLSLCRKTLRSLSLSPAEVEAYKKSNLWVYHSDSKLWGADDMVYALRNHLESVNDDRGKPYWHALRAAVIKSLIAFQISDNIGNKTIPYFIKLDRGHFETGCDWPLCKIDYALGDLDEWFTYGTSADANSHNKKFIISKNRDNWRFAISFNGHVSSSSNDLYVIPRLFLGIDRINETQYLQYNEDEISQLSAINIAPVDPSTIKTDDSATNSTTSSQASVKNQMIDGHEFVDLGLPSGTLWATQNVGANSPDEAGAYLAWGFKEPLTAYGRYDYYGKCTTSLKQKSGNAKLDDADDVAYTTWGSNCIMPTKADFKELMHNCEVSFDREKKCCTLTGPNKNKIVLYVGGLKNGTETRYDDGQGFYWTSEMEDNRPICFKIDWKEYHPLRMSYDVARFWGMLVRPVSKKK